MWSLMLLSRPVRSNSAMASSVREILVPSERSVSRNAATESSTETEMYRAIADVARRHHPEALDTTMKIAGFTDSQYFRRMVIASYGLGPFPLTQNDSRGVHGNHERLSIEALRSGVRFYYEVVSRVAAI